MIFAPAVGQPAQGIGVTLTFVPVRAVVNLRPGALAEGLLGKQVHGVTQVFVAGPPLGARPVRRVGRLGEEFQPSRAALRCAPLMAMQKLISALGRRGSSTFEGGVIAPLAGAKTRDPRTWARMKYRKRP
jgi:hypothetical protein